MMSCQKKPRMNHQCQHPVDSLHSQCLKALPIVHYDPHGHHNKDCNASSILFPLSCKARRARLSSNPISTSCCTASIDGSGRVAGAFRLDRISSAAAVAPIFDATVILLGGVGPPTMLPIVEEISCSTNPGNCKHHTSYVNCFFCPNVIIKVTHWCTQTNALRPLSKKM